MSEPERLWVQRTEPRQFVGRNARGGEVRIGRADLEGAFTPGELLQIALGACGLLSADATLADKLGEDFDSLAEIAADKSEDGSRYASIAVDIEVGMSAISAEARAALADRAERAIEKRCTVGHTLAAGAEHPVRVVARDQA